MRFFCIGPKYVHRASLAWLNAPPRHRQSQDNTRHPFLCRMDDFSDRGCGVSFLSERKLTMSFASILYETATPPSLPDQVAQPNHFSNLNLDQVVAAATAGRDEHNLRPFFHSPPSNLETVHYRHEAMTDLEQDSVLAFVNSFSKKMRSMREQITKVNKLYYRFQKERVFLDAIAFYCDAVFAMANDLSTARLQSRGLLFFQEHVAAYVKSPVFKTFKMDMEDIKVALSAIEYSLLIRDTSVTARTRGPESDYSAAVERTFVRFKQDAEKDYDFKFRDFFEKTTFARTFGQLHYLARLDCPVPSVAAKLFFYDKLLTHFEKEEDIHNHRGKLEDDLVRVHSLLRQATPQSIVILNEIFTSTTLRDALFLARRILERSIELDLLCVCLTSWTSSPH